MAQLGGVSADPVGLGTGVVNRCGLVPVFVDPFGGDVAVYTPSSNSIFLFGASGGLAAGASGGLIFGI